MKSMKISIFCSKLPPETDTFGKFFKNHVKVVFLMVPNLSKILKSGFKPLNVHTFGKFFQKSCENGDFDFCWSAPQFVQNIKPIRQLLCTFSSGSDLGIYIIYNIYKFQENQRTKKGSLSLFTFHFHFHSQPAG